LWTWANRWLTFARRLSESSTTNTPALTPYRLSKTCTLICNSSSQGTFACRNIHANAASE
jgi:hypothetical protein